MGKALVGGFGLLVIVALVMAAMGMMAPAAPQAAQGLEATLGRDPGKILTQGVVYFAIGLAVECHGEDHPHLRGAGLFLELPDEACAKTPQQLADQFHRLMEAAAKRVAAGEVGYKVAEITLRDAWQYALRNWAGVK